MAEMSWSDNRQNSKSSGKTNKEKEKQLESLRQLNLALSKLSFDDDLHEYLPLAHVQRAIQHWTGKARLPAEDAATLLDNRDVIYVFQRVQMLQAACKYAGVSQVPLDLLLNRADKVPGRMVPTLFPAIAVSDLSANSSYSITATTRQTSVNSSARSASISNTEDIKKNDGEMNVAIDKSRKIGDTSTALIYMACGIIAVTFALVANIFLNSSNNLNNSNK